ncbi:MAG: GAF domain-containing protein [Nitrospinae bacterium]|nr:GAF domain-containing protein [Nitrospinota bacterium]
MTRLAIIGMGRGGSLLLSLFKRYKDIDIVGVADKNEDAPGLKKARSEGIITKTDLKELIEIADLDMVVDTTGDPNVPTEIKNIKPSIEILGGVSSRLLWGLIEEHKDREKEVKETLREQKRLYDIGILLSSVEKIDVALDIIVDNAMKLTRSPAGSIVLYQEERNEMSLKIAKGLSPRFSEKPTWKIRHGGMIEDILKQRSPTHIPDIRKEPSFASPVRDREGIRSLIATPLVADDKILGIIYVYDFKPRVFSEKEISILSLFSTQASFALAKIQLMEELEERFQARTVELRENRSKLEAMISGMYEGVIFCDKDNRISIFNEVAERLLKIKKKGKIRSSIKDCHSPSLLEKVMLLIDDFRFGRKRSYSIEKRINDQILLCNFASIMHDKTYLGTLMVFRDVTEEKNLHKRLIEVEKMATLGEVTSTIAHEIRNPLVSVGGFTRRLHNMIIKQPSYKRYRRYTELIIKEVDRLEEMLRNVVDYSRELEFNLSSRDINELISKKISLMSDLFKEKRIKSKIDLYPNLPNVYIDQDNITQVFINIISNSIHAMPNGGILSIRTLPLKKDDIDKGVSIEISDTGGGIPPDIEHNVFNPFFTTKDKRIGLGLPLTKKIIDSLGGSIELTNKIGKGLTVVIKLPTKGTRGL